MPAPADQKVTFQSVHRYNVDKDRRVLFPSDWLAAKSAEMTMIIWPQHDSGTCLRVLPQEEMEKLRQKIEAMPTAERTSLKRHIGSASATIKLDKNNRITLLPEMAEAADIKDEAVFTGMLDYFEIWGPSRFTEMQGVEKRVVANALKSLE